ncbi:acyl transferase/acyl hydrolase/lysophospholipase [Diaporthe sp. PMI_573]|nr:acyl transferase/acyl hydrolase/lysophospholipase [Diaporthaceae sp. PMI_573]
MDTPSGLGRPPRILSLDGGGIRGKSSLLILENIMERIRESQGLNQVPRPCEYFDLIGGTSTGGIIAIMLGRLRMTVNECIQAYDKVSEAAFTPKRRIFPLPAEPKGAFSATALEKAIKQVVRENCTDPECTAKRSKDCAHDDLLFRDTTCTKTVVLAIRKANIGGRPELFKTYDTDIAFQDCCIWQVARATSAATTFFKSIQVGRDKIEFIDAGFGYNNPAEILIAEAERLFFGHDQLRILSIGTGLEKVVPIQNSRLVILKALKAMATESKKVAKRLEDKYKDGGQYYRFNVEQGLEDITLSDYQEANTIAAHTRSYLADNQRALQKFLDDFFNPPEGHSRLIAEPGGMPHRATRYSIPFPRNQYFVGRDTILQDLRQKLFIQPECQKLAIVGLGGVGKTQVALQFAFWVQENRPEYSVFWLSALSETTFYRDYLEIGRKAELPMDANNEEARMLVKQYLESSGAGKWLLIIDNIDKKTQLATIKDYLPIHDDGLVLFTTRSAEIATSAARADIVELHQMAPKEATNFLKRSLFHKELIEEGTISARLLEELTYLPLAIVQAAAYLNCNPHLTIQRYIDLLHGTDKDVVSLMTQEFPDDTRYQGVGNAVATTWIVSFTQIQQTNPAAHKLLSFLSCIEPKTIPQSLLPRMECQQDQESAIGTLVGLAFLARRQNGDVYDMHSLVHLATRVWIEKEARMQETVLNALNDMETVFTDEDGVNEKVWRSYFPHSIRLLQWSKDCCIDERFSLSAHVGMRLDKDRQFKEAIKCLEDVWEWKQKTFREEDDSRLTSEHALASAYLNDRRIEEAIEMFEHVVEVEKRTLREEDHSRLASEHELARAYLNDRRIKEAMEMFEHVVEVRKRTLREEDYDRLASEHELARAYLDDRRIKEAIEILEHVVELERGLLAEDDPDRLMSLDLLEGAYGKLQE